MHLARLKIECIRAFHRIPSLLCTNLLIFAHRLRGVFVSRLALRVVFATVGSALKNAASNSARGQGRTTKTSPPFESTVSRNTISAPGSPIEKPTPIRISAMIFEIRRVTRVSRRALVYSSLRDVFNFLPFPAVLSWPKESPTKTPTTGTSLLKRFSSFFRIRLICSVEHANDSATTSRSPSCVSSNESSYSSADFIRRCPPLDEEGQSSHSSASEDSKRRENLLASLWAKRGFSIASQS